MKRLLKKLLTTIYNVIWNPSKCHTALDAVSRHCRFHSSNLPIIQSSAVLRANANQSIINKISSFFHSSTLPLFHSSKKMLCIFLVGVFFFNGFVPKSQEVRNNFFMALSCVVHSAVFEVFSQCTEAVTTISNKLAHELIELIVAETGSTKPVDSKNEDNRQSVPANTSADSGIVTERTVSEQSQFSIVKTTVNYISFIAVNDLFRLYGNVKVFDNNNMAATMFMLLIILFAIYTTRIKDVINNILKIKYVIEPACI